MIQETHQNVLLAGLDQPAVRLLLELLAQRGVHGRVAQDLPSARSAVLDEPWDLVITAPGGAGADPYVLPRQVKEHSPELPVILISPRGSVQEVVRAIREGCDDYLVHPAGRAALEEALDRYLPRHGAPPAGAGEHEQANYPIAGQSPRLLEVIRLARKVAPTSVPVLITGESGTGKELLAHLVHRASNRRRGPYVRVNCAAVSETLLESELFGHERGAFTGAIAQRKGRFERAHGGTLLLDEISETGPRLQAELLRVLETQDFERVGGSAVVRVNVRVVSTTNRNLNEDVAAGRFRRDLYYRIGAVRLHVPPLRERAEDIALLAWHFVRQYAAEARRQIVRLDAGMLEWFARCPWPGNIRQLRNVVRAALILGEGPVLSAPPALLEQADLAAPRPDHEGLRLEAVERRAIVEALRQTNSHYLKAAQLLGISDRTLREKMRRYRSQASGCTGEGQCQTEPA